MTTTFAGKSAEQWRAMARDRWARKAESWDRCETDGFLSQWASEQMALKFEDCARVAEDGGIECSALFDLDGNLLDAFYHVGVYGPCWGIREGENIRWVAPSQAKHPDTKRRNNAKKGIYVGWVLRKAYLDKTTGDPRPLNGAEHVVKIIDNGHN